MNKEILWLVRLGLNQDLFSREQAFMVRQAVGPEAELMDFAQKLIDDGIVEDLEALETLAGNAMAKAADGPPENDPFAEAHTASASDDESTEDEEAPAAAELVEELFDFPFTSMGDLDDAALADTLRELLTSTARTGASDLHFSTGARPFIRKDRSFSFINDHALTAEEALRLNTVLLSEGQKKTYLDLKDYDYALALSHTDRYRVNLMFHKEGSAGAYRMVPAEIKSLKELGFSEHLKTLEKMLSFHNGLILVTGPVGSGKTTTLASMVDFLNASREDHIITVEDPIEVVHMPKGCNVSQREVGPHTRSFGTALKGALREDPDIIIIGELRDLETIEMAISASETGHLVIGTMHTSDATTTLTRLLDVFPPGQQTQIRSSVAESLRGIICQRLLPAPDGGLTLACEIMVNNIAISNLIKEGKSAGLRNAMETGLRDGMCLMDNVVFALWKNSEITTETALANIANRVLRAKVT